MAKFKKDIEKMLTFTDMKDIENGLTYLTDVSEALRDVISQYSDLEKLNDARFVWYSNARDSYEEKLHQVDSVILRLEAKRVASLQTTPSPDAV